MTFAEIEENFVNNEQSVDDFSLADRSDFWSPQVGDMLEPGKPVIFGRDLINREVGTLVGHRRTAVPNPRRHHRLLQFTYFPATSDAQFTLLAEGEFVVVMQTEREVAAAPQINIDDDLYISDETLRILTDDMNAQSERRLVFCAVGRILPIAK